jgi:thioester reductase-like protein
MIDVLTGMTSSNVVEEGLVQDPIVSVGSGYTESKWVAEHILAAAAETTRVKPAIMRLGQLSGGRDGYWKTTEWIPSMIASGHFLGVLPNRSNVSFITNCHNTYIPTFLDYELAFS